MDADPEACWRVSFAGEASYRRGYDIDNHRRTPSPRAAVQCCLEGDLLWRDRHGERRVTPPHVLLFTGDERSRYRLDPASRVPYRCCWVSLAGAGIDVLWRALVERFGAVVGPDDGRIATAIRALSPASPVSAVHAFVGTLCAWLEEQHQRGASPVERAVAAIERDPFSDVTVGSLAASYGVSREHLSLRFRQRHGLGPAAWLRRRRLAYARELRQGTQLPLGEIARLCGMGNARRLSRALKRAGTGETTSSRPR